MIQPEALVHLLIMMMLFFVPLYFVVKAAVVAGIRQASRDRQL